MTAELAVKAQAGELCCVAAPGFEISAQALFEDAANQAMLRRLLAR